jgi:hypothetical protein
LSPTCVVIKRCTRAMLLAPQPMKTTKCQLTRMLNLFVLHIHFSYSSLTIRLGLLVTKRSNTHQPLTLTLSFNQIDLPAQSTHHHCLMYSSMSIWTMRSPMPVRAHQLTAGDRNLFFCTTLHCSMSFRQGWDGHLEVSLIYTL